MRGIREEGAARNAVNPSMGAPGSTSLSNTVRAALSPRRRSYALTWMLGLHALTGPPRSSVFEHSVGGALNDAPR